MNGNEEEIEYNIAKRFILVFFDQDRVIMFNRSKIVTTLSPRNTNSIAM